MYFINFSKKNMRCNENVQVLLNRNYFSLFSDCDDVLLF